MKEFIRHIIKEELLKEEKVVNFDSPNNNFVVITFLEKYLFYNPK